MDAGSAAGGKLRWGILSTADIGLRKVVPAIMKSPHSQVVAMASRDAARARSALDGLGLPAARAHGTYEALLADPEVDAIYNPLPNHLHVEWTLAAARAGKHVLCEKPIGLDAADAARLLDCPPGVIVAEAFMIRFHPQWQRAREIVRSGELGEIRAVRAVFCYHNTDPANVRNMAGIGGGGILDIGCYPVLGARFLLDAEPLRVVALVDRDPVFKTDRLASVIADFGGGVQLSFVCSTQLAGCQSIEVLGTKGRVELVIPFNAPADATTELLAGQGRRETIATCDQYTEQAESFALAVLTGAPFPYGVADAVRNMRTLDAIFASEKTGGWVAVGG